MKIKVSTRIWLAWQVLRGRMVSFTASWSTGDAGRVNVEFVRTSAMQQRMQMRGTL